MGVKYYGQYGRELLECGYADDRQPKHMGESEKGVAALVAILELMLSDSDRHARLDKVLEKILKALNEQTKAIKEIAGRDTLAAMLTKKSNPSDGMLKAKKMMMDKQLTAEFYDLLSPRTQTMLERGRFKSLSDLTYDNLMEMRGCGAKAMREINEAAALVYDLEIAPNN